MEGAEQGIDEARKTLNEELQKQWRQRLSSCQQLIVGILKDNETLFIMENWIDDYDKDCIELGDEDLALQKLFTKMQHFNLSIGRIHTRCETALGVLEDLSESIG